MKTLLLISSLVLSISSFAQETPTYGKCSYILDQDDTMLLVDRESIDDEMYKLGYTNISNTIYPDARYNLLVRIRYSIHGTPRINLDPYFSGTAVLTDRTTGAIVSSHSTEGIVPRLMFSRRNFNKRFARRAIRSALKSLRKIQDCPN